MTDALYRDTLSFTTKLGQALARYGAPAHRIEDVLGLLTQDLGVDGIFSATPSILLMEFRGAEKSEVRMERVHANEIDLTRLRQLDELFNQVAEKSIHPADGLKRLEEIVDAPPSFGPSLDVVAYALTSAAATPLFGGGITDMVLGALAGLTVAIVARIAPERLLVPLGGFSSSLMVVLIAPLIGQANVDAAILGGIIVLVPGFTLTLGVSELVTHNITAGVSRLGAALVTSLSLSFGVLVGTATGGQLLGVSALTPGPAPPVWLNWLLVPVAVITINILFRAPKGQWGWIFLTSSLTFSTLELSNHFLPPPLAVFMGGLTLGIASNIYARTKNLPAAIIRMPGLLFLVPGSLSFLSIQAVMSGQSSTATVTMGQLTLVAISLVMGMVVAGSVVPPRKAL